MEPAAARLGPLIPGACLGPELQPQNQLGGEGQSTSLTSVCPFARYWSLRLHPLNIPKSGTDGALFNESNAL